MSSSRYVALLRGINVGGRNKVPMAELRTAVEDVGHTDVTTYIQSGNVLFTSSKPRASLEAGLERALERHFGFPLVVVVRSHAQLRRGRRTRAGEVRLQARRLPLGRDLPALAPHCRAR